MKKLSAQQAISLLQQELAKYNEYKSMGLKLDMSRGKPCKEQLDLSKGLFDILNSSTEDFGAPDYRNYGLVDGIPEAKRFFAELCELTKTRLWFWAMPA